MNSTRERTIHDVPFLCADALSGPPEALLNGVLVVDKPAGMTSHDVVSRVRRLLGLRAVGHLGTLDPAATGVLPLVLGKATRLARFIPSAPKEYSGDIRLGWATTTCDQEGEPLGEARIVDVDIESVLEAMANFTGRIQQIPPAFSAKKISGTRAHRLARRGIPVELKPIDVEIQAFELERFDPPVVRFRVVCSEGTYVRSLARDLGERLGTQGHLASLRRTRSGNFQIRHAVPLDAVSPEHVLAPEQLLAHLPRLQIALALEDDIRHGRPVPCEAPGSPVCIFNKTGQLLAVASVERGWAHPRVVLI